MPPDGTTMKTCHLWAMSRKLWLPTSWLLPFAKNGRCSVFQTTSTAKQVVFGLKTADFVSENLYTPSGGVSYHIDTDKLNELYQTLYPDEDKAV